MLHSLPLFHRIAGAKVVVIGDGEMAAAKRRLVERAGGVCVDEAYASDARLAFVATEHSGDIERAAARLRQRGLLVNVADRPDLCDFTLPSVLERGDVLVAVSTGGASAGLAKQLRMRLEALLPSSLGVLAQALRTAREAIRTRWPDATERRHALDAALTQGGPLDPLDTASAERLEAWLTSAHDTAIAEVATIDLASDDPDDLTLRQARLLGAADTIIHAQDVPTAILARARADAVRMNNQDSPAAGLTVILRRPEREQDQDLAGQTSFPASLPNSSK
jgi:uroporphyrin-III C-methyltransferase/precorrin-2 dehydrogenase/sirohydrochlorin ferrochelatase